MDHLNPLERKPALRIRIYDAFWVVGLALGGTQVGYAAADVGQPTWLAVALTVYVFVGGAIGFTARQNVDRVGGGVDG